MFRAPTLLSVSHVQRHPEAVWTLPPSVEASEIQVARKADTGTDGAFFNEKVVISDVLAASDTHWLYESQLGPGTYYVHVRGWDRSCFDTNFVTECGYAWSNALVLTIRDMPPRITKLMVTPSVGWYMSATARVCDDTKAPVTFRVTEKLTKRKPYVTVRRTFKSDHFGGCDFHNVSWRLSSKIRTHVRYGQRLVVTFLARDARGHESNSVTRGWDILD